MASIRIEGVKELQAKLGRAGANRTLRDPMHRAVLRLQRDMADYPDRSSGELFVGPRQANYKPYIRTGTLGRRWTTKVSQSGAGVTGKVGNNTEYAPWVQSERFQAGIHRGNWQTDEQVVERNRDRIVGDFQREIDKALEGK